MIYQKIMLICIASFFAIWFLNIGLRRKSIRSVVTGLWYLFIVGVIFWVPREMQLTVFILSAGLVSIVEAGQINIRLSKEAFQEVKKRRSEPGGKEMMNSIILTDATDVFATAKVLRGIYITGLNDLDNRLLNLPLVLKNQVCRAEAQYIKENLENAGAKVNIS